MEMHPNPIPTPEVFWSFETGKPLSRCRLCETELIEADVDHLIEKAYKNDETIFEHAICLPCHARCQKELSEESRERIGAYFAEHANMELRQQQMCEAHGTDHGKWLGHCIVKGYPIHECDEYQIYGFCSGKSLVFAGAPYMICGEALDEVLDLMSNQTLGVLDDLSQRLFGIDAPKGLLAI